MVADSNLDLRKSLTHAREAVDQQWRSRILNGEEATETELTVTYIEAASPKVRYAQFNPREEARTGADWLWWFLDDSGECFGMLVQAKKLKRLKGEWTIDFGYVSGGEPQINKLLEASNRLDVPAFYVLYCGDRRHRQDLSCGTHHNEKFCTECDSASVSILPSLCARHVNERQLGATAAFHMSTPVEDLVTPGTQGSEILDLNLNVVGLELKKFLLSPQSGSREVAKKVFAMTSRLRSGSFALATATLLRVKSETVFDYLPDDSGHFGVSYFEHILRGLKPSLPDEVQEALAGNEEGLLRKCNRLQGVAVFSF